MAGRTLNFSFGEGDSLEIEGVPVKAILTTSSAVLYVTEKLILG